MKGKQKIMKEGVGRRTKWQRETDQDSKGMNGSVEYLNISEGKDMNRSLKREHKRAEKYISYLK